MNKKLINFPCQFPLKVVGLSDSPFREIVVSILKKHITDFNEDQITLNPSKQKKYISLTITFEAHSQEQLDQLYQELSDEPLVLVAL